MNLSQSLPTSESSRAVSDNKTLHAILDWIDRELGEAYGRESGKGGNTLLELRKSFQSGSLNQVVSRFFRQLPKLELQHYLLGFRIRTLLSSQIELRISDPLARTPDTLAPLRLQGLSTAAIRRHFFEHATAAIPMTDIRIEFVWKNDPANAFLE